MTIRDGTLEAIGDTPVIRLRHLVTDEQVDSGLKNLGGATYR